MFPPVSTRPHPTGRSFTIFHFIGLALCIFLFYHFYIVHSLSNSSENLPSSALLRQYPEHAPAYLKSEGFKKRPAGPASPIKNYRNDSGTYYKSPRSFFADKYRFTEDERICEDNFGFGLIERWHDSMTIACEHSATTKTKYPTTFHKGTITQQGHALPNTHVDVQNLYFDFDKIKTAKGGEKIADVMGRAEGEEFVKFGAGAMGGKCKPTSTDALNPEGFQYHTKHWMASWTEHADDVTPTTIINEPVLMVTRYEYANFYHTQTDFFQAFMSLELAGLSPQDVRVIIMDGHPEAPFDEAWSTVYSPVFKMSRASDYKGLVLFRRAVFVQPGYEAPISTDWGTPNACKDSDLVKAFAAQFLEAYGLREEVPPALNKIQVMFIFREDYIAHPRESDKGRRRNKISNENDLAILAQSDATTVEAVNLAKIPFKEQLAIMRSKQVVFGMHGAGLSHIPFLPRDAVVVEMFPNYIQPRKQHFRNLARWSNKVYMYHQNQDASNEVDFYSTKIELKTIKPTISAAIRVAQNFNDRNGMCRSPTDC